MEVILHLRRLTLLFLLSLIRLGQNKRKISTLFCKTEETIAFLTTLTIEKELEFLVEKVLLQIFFTQMSVTWPQILSEFEMRVPCQTLVNAELGKVDYPKMHEQQVNSATKAVLDLVQNTETLRCREPPPILGNSCYTDKTWEAVKMLRRELGLCDVEKEDSIHIQST
jgi:hypothetical protein